VKRQREDFSVSLPFLPQKSAYIPSAKAVGRSSLDLVVLVISQPLSWCTWSGSAAQF